MNDSKSLPGEMERLQVSDPNDVKQTCPKNFTLLEDVPVDSFDAQNTTVKKSSSRPPRPNWLLTEPIKRSSLLNDGSTLGTSDNKSLPSRSKKDQKVKSEDSRVPRTTRSKSKEKKDEAYSVISKAKKSRPILSQIFGGVSLNPSNIDIKLRPIRSDSNLLEPEKVSQNGFREDKEEQYEMVTVKISKTKQSLGELKNNYCKQYCVPIAVCV